ncbi:MAG: hypothetical protein C5B57_01055 [Blastocatellia bacterium]|nr:MAG: hypothetical protein C5B57_01055 [Blastocatellia bacterium]
MDSAPTAANVADVDARPSRLPFPYVVPLFAITLFSGSFLMFMVEPMIAKMVLPILGGAPMVWNTCVVFFQTVLLLGYAYAHGSSAWIKARRHTFIYAILLVLPLATLPFRIHSASAATPTAHPIAWLFVALVTSIGPAFFVLSTGASIFQKWFSATDHVAARDPYFLYAASNLGSLISLAAYPALIEPTLRLDDQARLWAIGYGVFALLALVCVALVRRHPLKAIEAAAATAAHASSDRVEELTWRRRSRWLALAFVPSSLMLGVTSYMSTDIAAVPLLWVVPLWLYLLTFVVTFGSKGDTARVLANRFLPLAVLPLTLVMIARLHGPVSAIVPLHLFVFATAAMLCHGELAHDRPTPRHLTEFYFWLALGGMAGGLFNTLIAPIIFDRIVEYPLVLGLACLMRSARAGTDQKRHLLDVVVPLCVTVLAILLITGIGGGAMNPRVVVVFASVLAVIAFRQSPRPVPFAVSVGAMLLITPWLSKADETVLHAQRTFFGVYRVSLDRNAQYHALAHGTTLHGMQALDPARQSEPLTYFHRTGPFGQMFAVLPQVSQTPNVAVVGLGVGTLASYATSDQHWTFFEIDPAVEHIARNPAYFTYLRQCGDRCRIVLGDARLSLAHESDTQYGLIVLDAFSSDAIPMHLITREALSLYLRHLAPQGVMAFHISNRHVLLNAILARLAASHQLPVLEQRDLFSGAGWPKDKTESHWVVMARADRDLGALQSDPRWSPPALTASTPLWTDDFSNILGVLSLR